jgi:hypothetical protein
MRKPGGMHKLITLNERDYLSRVQLLSVTEAVEAFAEFGLRNAMETGARHGRD